jgi:hypothetical protein
MRLSSIFPKGRGDRSPEISEITMINLRPDGQESSSSDWITRQSSPSSTVFPVTALQSTQYDWSSSVVTLVGSSSSVNLVKPGLIAGEDAKLDYKSGSTTIADFQRCQHSNKRSAISLPALPISFSRPLLPVIHVLCLVTHLSLTAITPYLVFSGFVLPLVLWVMTTVLALLETIYLGPGLVMEAVGLVRGRPL